MENRPTKLAMETAEDLLKNMMLTNFIQFGCKGGLDLMKETVLSFNEIEKDDDKTYFIAAFTITADNGETIFSHAVNRAAKLYFRSRGEYSKENSYKNTTEYKELMGAIDYMKEQAH